MDKSDSFVYVAAAIAVLMLLFIGWKQWRLLELRREPMKLWQRSDIPRTEFTANHNVGVHQTTRGYVEVRP